MYIYNILWTTNSSQDQRQVMDLLTCVLAWRLVNKDWHFGISPNAYQKTPFSYELQVRTLLQQVRFIQPK